MRYLLGTPQNGIRFKPDHSTGMECYADADFAGGFQKETANDVSTLYSRFGHIIYYAGCTVLWASKLQTQIALWTSETEYIALSTTMRDVIPFMTTLQELKSTYL